MILVIFLLFLELNVTGMYLVCVCVCVCVCVINFYLRTQNVCVALNTFDWDLGHNSTRCQIPSKLGNVFI